MGVSSSSDKADCLPLHLQLYVFIREEMYSRNCWLFKQPHTSHFTVTWLIPDVSDRVPSFKQGEWIRKQSVVIGTVFKCALSVFFVVTVQRSFFL